MLLNQREPSKIRWRLPTFYDATLDAAMPETTRLARTVETWWPAILVALTHDVSNARTQWLQSGHQTDQTVGYGFRSQANYRRRMLSHIAVTRPQKSAA